MTTITRAGLRCRRLAVDDIAIDIALDVGPRIMGLSRGGSNVLAELPETVITAPGTEPYHCWGGHRLWVAPEVPEFTYESEDHPVDLIDLERGAEVRRLAPSVHGIGRSMRITWEDDTIVVGHTISNTGGEEMRVAPWAITQLPLGGIAAIAIGGKAGSAFQANRSVVLWPYTGLDDPRLTVEDDLVAVEGAAGSPLKIGAAGHAGWLAYLRSSQLFVKQFEPRRSGEYADLGATAQMFTGPEFLELETVGPIAALAPGEEVHHEERWSLHSVEGGISPPDLVALVEEDIIR